MKVSRPFLFICISLFLLFIGCVKKEAAIVQPETQIPDTIKPLSYFPAYPGSWWKYQVIDSTGTTTITYSTSPTYLGHSFCRSRVDFSNCKTSSNLAYVPFYNGKPIYGYKNLWTAHAPFVSDDFLYEFLTEKTGPCSIRPELVFCDPRYSGYFCLEEELKDISKIKNALSDTVLIAKGHFINTAGLPNLYKTHQITQREYTKNIGLTRYWIYDTILHDTLTQTRLIDHFINH